MKREQVLSSNLTMNSFRGGTSCYFTNAVKIKREILYPEEKYVTATHRENNKLTQIVDIINWVFLHKVTIFDFETG